MTPTKPQARLLGFDDGPFTFDDQTTPLVGVMTRGGGYVEAVMAGQVTVDGADATEAVIDLAGETGLLETVQGVVFNGGTVGGFNVLDLEAVHHALGLPVAAVIRDPPDHDAVEDALTQHFDDADDRLDLLTAQPLEPVALGEGTVHVRRVGGSLEALAGLLRVNTVQGRRPEPLRIAHLIATAIAEGRSRGA